MSNHYPIGYARVSTRSQNPDSQVDALLRAGCAEENVFIDYASGVRASRPEWDRLQTVLRSGDQLVITKLDRAGRNMRHLLALVDDLQERQVELRVLDQGIDTTTPAGRLFMHMLAAMAEFERDMIAERVQIGLRSARARGRSGGRPKLLNTKVAIEVARLYDEGDLTIGEIASMVKCSRASVYRALRKDLGDRLTREEASRISSLHREDEWSVEAIAADMGFSIPLVRRALSIGYVRTSESDNAG